MSQTSSNKGKEISSKKYTSFNISQTFKSKVDNKTGSVQGLRHGMQSLGKIGQSRRVLQPASLPSLKKENSGNDPRVNLVPPTGSQGWVKKDGQSSVDGTSSGSIDLTKTTVVKNPTNNQEISLRPHAGVVPGARPSTGGVVEEGQKPSWVSKVQPQPPQGATKYFQREFPTLGGDVEKDITAENHAEKTEQDASHLVMAHHQAFINGQKWMDGSNSPMMVPANFSQFKGDPAQMFSGQQQCYSFPMQMYPGDMHNYPLHPMYMPYTTGPAGKIPLNLYQRIPNSVLNTNPQPDQTSVSKDSDKDDNGWAGAQEEVDYNAKLKFDESDESDDDAAKKPKEENSQKLDQSEEHKQEKNKAPPEGWTESQSFPTQVHMQPAAYNHQTWSRMPFNFDPRAPVPYFFIPRYPFPVVMPTPSELSDRNIENKSKEAEHLKESPPIKPDDKREADRKAAAQAKLRKVEEDIKKREAEKKHNEADGKKTSSFEIEDKVNVGLHKRSDSEASDSSRHTRDIPPRFQRQVSAQKQSATSISSEVNPNDTIVDSHMRTILKRKESYKSDEEFVKDDLFKKPDSVESTGHEPEKTSHEVKVNQTTSSLNQETLKAEHKSSSEVIDKPHKLSNVTNKEVVRKPTLHPDKEKKGLKELTDFKAEIKNRDQKKNEIILTEKNQDSRFDSERFADFKLTKGQVKKTKLGKEKGESASATEFQEREPSRTSAWNKVLPNETNQSSATKKSLIEIQKEEEELSKKAVEGKLLDKSQIVAESINGQERSSPTENKFRSDTYQNKPFPKHENEHQNDHRGRLDDDSKRRYNKFERDNQKHDFKSRDDGYRDHPRDNYRKRNEYIPKDSLLQSNEESLTKSSQKDYDVRRESRRDYPRYNDREGFKKEYDRPKRDRGDREYNKYKKDRGDADYEKYKKERGDGEKDRYKKDRGDNESDRYKKDRGDGENERYRKDKVDVESDRFKKVRSDLEYTRIKKDKGETDYENKHKKDKGELEHDRIKKDRGDGEFERHKKDRGDGEFERHKKDRGDGEYDRFKKDRGDASYKRNGKVDKYSEKFLPKSASIELQVDLVDLKQEMSTEKSINKSNEGDKILKPIKRDNEKYETSRRDREFYSRNTDRKKEYSSDYHKQDRRGSRRNDRKDSFYDKDSGKKYSNKFSHEDDLKTSKRDSIISKEVKTENITLDASEKVLSKDEDLKNVAEAKEQKDSSIVKDMPKKDSSNKEVIDIKSDTFTKGDCTKEISVTQPKSPKYKSRKIDDHYRFTDKSSYNYLDSKDEAYEGVGRGRGRQSRGHEHSSGNKSNDKIRLSLEDVSDEELISGDEGSSLKTRKPGKKTHQKTWEHDRPPRFQQKYENEDVFRGRGVRGSDRSRTNHGRGRGASNFHSRVEEKITQENVNKNSSEVIGSVDEQSPIATNQQFAEQRRPQSNQDRGFKSRGRNSYRGNGSSSSSGLRLDKSDSFLVNRQQLGSTHTSSNIINPQTAADKIDSSELDENILNKKSASNLEGISTTSPTKKNKPAEKKRDIRREFDLSNIASVVCIDDMKNFDSISIKSTEDDGFVKVTSKKHQKELRDKYREEEKRKVLLEQKKEASKAQKLARKEKVALKKAVAPVPEVSVSISEQLPVSAHIPLPVTSVTPISQPPTSNLHDMMGVWEPAQSLMRTSQSNPLSDQISSAGSVSSNAWQRPLTLTSTSASLPDPRAVGTGKPVSVPGAIKVTIMPTQATPEAASPIVTPPPLAPIISGNGVSMISELDNSNTNLKRDFAKNKSSEGKQQLSQNTHKAQITNDEVQRKVRSNPKKEPKSASKKYLPERPPRFQANLRKNGDERTKKYSEPRKEKYSGKRDEKSHRLSDRLKKVEKFPSDIKPPKSVEKPIALNNNEVFLNENVSEEMQTKSLLSEEEKVVGSKKPSIKTQTSVGSYKSSDVFEEPVKEVKLANQFQTPQDNINKSLSKESEKNAKKTAQSLVKSITGDEERSLETRSLPGSPSLAVKIPEPTLCGPSSDPGKVPDPNINKFASSIAQEMNEMNRKLLDAKKAWDETPTAWSDSASKVKTVSVVSSSSASDSIPAHTECLPTVTKFEQLSTVSITEVKSTEEKASQSFPNKRPEQQNICKVKPQQQIPSEDSRAYISTNLQHNVSNLPTQSNRSRYVLNMDRQVQANIYESVYSDQLRTQGNQLAFSRLGHIHSIDQVVPPMSQRPEMVLSSLPVGNPNSHLFGIDPSIQNNQNALLTWQVVSTTNVQPTKTLHYPAQHHQGSLFTSPSSSQLVMPYGSAFSPQRSSTGIQRQALMQHNQTAVMSPQEVNLNIQEPYVGRVVGVLQPQPAQSQARRDHHQQFQGILPSQPLLGTNSMTLLLDPSNAQTHLSQQQRSDLMKHVHAKPFEPTSQTPPLMQSPPVLSHHHSATPMPQQVISTVFSQSVTHQQTQQKYSQPLIHRQTNHQQANPLVAPVRPRAVHGQSSGTSPPLRTLSNHQEQIMNNHHFDQNFVFPNALGLGHPPRGSVIQPVHVTPHPISSQYVGSFLQQPYQQNVQSRPPTFNHSQNKPPGPIQRPLQISPSNYSSINHSSNDEEFKRIQRQKMLDDTKKYFQSDGSAPSGNNGMAKEDVSSTSTTLSKHDKLIIPDKQKDKRFDFKKSVRNGEQTRGTRNQRQKSSPSTSSSIPPGKAYDASQSKRSTSKV